MKLPWISEINCFFALVGCIFYSTTTFSQVQLNVVYPPENHILTAVDSTFVYGNVRGAQAEVFVNNLQATVYSNGAFLVFVPVEAGSFTFECVAKADSDTVRVTRNVMVRSHLGDTPSDTSARDSGVLFPQQDVELTAGDYLNVVFKGMPGMSASFTVSGLVKNCPMSESVASPDPFESADHLDIGQDGPHKRTGTGIYTGVYKIESGIELQDVEIEFRLRGTDGLDIRKKAPGRITIRNDSVPRVALITKESIGSNQIYLPRGVKLHITGKQGDFYRARLTDAEDIWVAEHDLEFLPSGTHIPSGTVSSVRTQNSPEKAIIRIDLEERLPFRIDQTNSPAALTVFIYGATSHTDEIHYDFEDKIVREMVWSQPSNAVYQLKVFLNEKSQWGFNPYYDGTNLVLEINKPPKEFSLKNLLVCLDPGHAPDVGAIGPTGIEEKDVNLQLALILQEKLTNKGASVFLTRRAYHGASTEARKKMAVLLGADLLISIHHDRPSDESNPFLKRGSSTHYFFSQSYHLAEAIQARLLEKLQLQSSGLYYDNQPICHLSQMPAVLVEPASIVHPEEEKLIATDKFRKKVADAIVDGIEDFLKYAQE